MSHPDPIKAEAIALGKLGYSAPKTARMLALKYGDDAPKRTAIYDWRNAVAQADGEEIEGNERRLILLADELIESKLLAIKEGEAKASLFELNAVSGTMRDKQFKRAELSQRNQGTQAAQSLADAINRLAATDTQHLASVIEGSWREPEPESVSEPVVGKGQEDG